MPAGAATSCWGGEDPSGTWFTNHCDMSCGGVCGGVRGGTGGRGGITGGDGPLGTGGASWSGVRNTTSAGDIICGGVTGGRGGNGLPADVPVISNPAVEPPNRCGSEPKTPVSAFPVPPSQSRELPDNEVPSLPPGEAEPSVPSVEGPESHSPIWRQKPAITPYRCAYSLEHYGYAPKKPAVQGAT